MDSPSNHQSTNVDQSTSPKAAAGTAPKQVNAASPLLLPSPADGRHGRKKSTASSLNPMSNRDLNDQKCLTPSFSRSDYFNHVSTQQPQLTYDDVRELTTSVASLMVDAAEDAAMARDKRDRAIAVGVDNVEEYDAPPYYWPMWTTDGWTGSVDMVRLTLRIRETAAGAGVPLLGRELDVLASMASAAKVGAARTTEIGNPGPGQYRRIWTLMLGECRGKEATVTVGIGRRSGKKVEELEGFAEYNPNKVARCPAYRDFHRLIVACCRRIELSRADLAFDYPVERWRVQAYKDLRNWSYIESSGAPASLRDRDTYTDLVSRSGRTTYLGVRSSPGLVKIYDKQKESGLSGPMTRVEVTVSGADAPADLARRWPIMQILPADLGAYNDASTAGMVFRLAAHGEEAEAILAGMEPRRARRVRKALLARRPPIDAPVEAMAELLGRAKIWTYDPDPPGRGFVADAAEVEELAPQAEEPTRDREAERRAAAWERIVQRDRAAEWAAGAGAHEAARRAADAWAATAAAATWAEAGVDPATD
ncbi:MAG: hypothetical protein KH396_05935 [Atopobiaceae bacterium]|nr:hypothetical protein [Atopobiaceae bacterium]